MSDDLADWRDVDRPGGHEGLRPQTVSLEQLRLGMQRVVSSRVGVGLMVGTPSVYRDPEVSADRLVMELEAFVLAEQLPPAQVQDTKRIEVQVPDGWWETFRHEYRDRWWMRRWVARRPVRLRSEVRVARLSVDLRRYWTFPRSRVTVPELGAPVRVVEWERQTTVEPR